MVMFVPWLPLIQENMQEQPQRVVKVNYEQLPEYMSALDSLADDAMEIHTGVFQICTGNSL